MATHQAQGSKGSPQWGSGTDMHFPHIQYSFLNTCKLLKTCSGQTKRLVQLQTSNSALKPPVAITRRKLLPLRSSVQAKITLIGKCSRNSAPKAHIPASKQTTKYGTHHVQFFSNKEHKTITIHATEMDSNNIYYISTLTIAEICLLYTESYI